MQVYAEGSVGLKPSVYDELKAVLNDNGCAGPDGGHTRTLRMCYEFCACRADAICADAICLRSMFLMSVFCAVQLNLGRRLLSMTCFMVGSWRT